MIIYIIKYHSMFIAYMIITISFINQKDLIEFNLIQDINNICDIFSFFEDHL